MLLQGLTYDSAQAAINGTVTMRLPKLLEVLLHHANYHLPTHMSISIPSYNLKAAHSYLQQRLGKYLTVANFNLRLLGNLMTAWLVYDEQRQRYVDFYDAEELVEQCKQRRQQKQQQQGTAEAAASSSSSASTSSGGEAVQAAAAAGGNGVQPSSSQDWLEQQQSSSPAAAYGG